MSVQTLEPLPPAAPAAAPAPHAHEAPAERPLGRFTRRDGKRLPYLPLAERNAIAAFCAVLWALVSMWLSLPWLDDLADTLSPPVAVTIVAGIAIIPGYLNAHLVVSLVFDRPPPIPTDGGSLPAVTVLIAAYNEQWSIGDTVRYALRQEYPGDVRVLVCDDGSTDATALTVRGIARRDTRVRLLTVPHGGKANALNAGLQAADTPVVATCDADTLLMPYALRRAVARLESSPRDTVAVAGSVMVRNSRANWLASMQTWDYLLGIGSVKRQQSLMRGTLVAQGAFSVYRTQSVRDVGGWPDMIGEDIVLTWAMLDLGGRTTYEPTAVAFTDVPTDLRAFLRQRQRWARGMIEGLRRHGAALVSSRRMYAHAVATNFAFPLVDVTFTLAFPPGLVLALTGNFMIVGPMTLAVLPLNALVLGFMYHKQRAVFDSLGLHIRRHHAGLLAYYFTYQLLLSPISVSGYAKELVRARRRW
jgi:biofilm PGA synthesis N-glycosyltransferase PgaC